MEARIIVEGCQQSLIGVTSVQVLIFGATGMVGQGVLRECLLNPDIDAVLTVGRTATRVAHAKLRELVRADLLHYGDIEADLRAVDACFFCLGISAGGLSEGAVCARDVQHRAGGGADSIPAECRHDVRLRLRRRNGQLGEGTRHVGAGQGKTENALMRLPFKGAYMFRPGIIQPMHEEQSKTPAYRILYSLTKPLFPLLRRLFPKYVLTTEEIGRAMLAVARHGAPKPILEIKDIRAAAGS